ncbi:hypothetical protein B1T48_11995 [Mycobacterium persicum]|nr:hypothetical protein B1T48_11995 [Mycobacterium persicum]
MSIPNVLASRYASAEMVAIWFPEASVVGERWPCGGHRPNCTRIGPELDVAIPQAAIADYERALEDVDLESIAARARPLRHDVKASIEELYA